MISFVKRLAVQAGQICSQEQKTITSNDITRKTPKDLVTKTDKKVEAFIVKEIKKAFPGQGILGEETGHHRQESPYLWIIDPIDGTTSFIHGQPFYAVSIALEKNGELILGAVYAPVFDQLFYAEKNKGAFLNGSPIQVSGTDQLIDAVMATGFACLRAEQEKNNLLHFNHIVPQLRDIRRYGSAAMDLCYLAWGRLDGYWEMNLNIYDIAAGALILTEAGGRISDFTGANDFPEQGVAAANPLLHPLLIRNLNLESYKNNT